jgi:hypothetical protein
LLVKPSGGLGSGLSGPGKLEIHKRRLLQPKNLEHRRIIVHTAT